MVGYLLMSIATSFASMGSSLFGLPTAAIAFKWASVCWLVGAISSYVMEGKE